TVHAVFSGHIMHTGTHMFDLLLYFLGSPLWVRSRIEKFRPSDSGVSGYKYINDEYFDDPSATAQLRFPGEVDVFISGLEKHYFIFEMDIIGSRGRIRLGNFMKELWLSRQSPHYKDFRELVRAPFPETPGSKNAWLRAVEDIINQINGCPGVGSTGEEACRSMEMAFGIMLSSLKNGSRISFPLEERDIKIISK
ncbi:MAG: hypothetical protein JW928_00485, partial [Candidatus Aureabacteria bacterium]|nr:hypothetical protein [Candidatus Auribacterota bacterium]